MKAVETVLHLRRQLPARLKHMVPPHIWALVAPYGVQSQVGETGAGETGPPIKPPSAASADRVG